MANMYAYVTVDPPLPVGLFSEEELEVLEYVCGLRAEITSEANVLM